MIDGNVFTDTHAMAIKLETDTSTTVSNNVFIRNGQAGLTAFQSVGARVVGNKVWNANTNQFLRGWEAGGFKFWATKNTVCEENDVWGIFGNGIWFDGGYGAKLIICSPLPDMLSHRRNTDSTIRNNIVHHCQGDGIFYEISSRAQIYGNKVWDCTELMFISSSNNVDCYDNIVAWVRCCRDEMVH